MKTLDDFDFNKRTPKQKLDLLDDSIEHLLNTLDDWSDSIIEKDARHSLILYVKRMQDILCQ